jgi:hypothetical protein
MDLYIISSVILHNAPLSDPHLQILPHALLFVLMFVFLCKLLVCCTKKKDFLKEASLTRLEDEIIFNCPSLQMDQRMMKLIY